MARYSLDVSYQPATDRLTGVAEIKARATQDLSRFNLDLKGLTVRSISVDGRSATWSRSGAELTVVPRHGIEKRRHFTTLVRYDGVPETAPGPEGFIHTDDGSLVIGEPHVASSWFPVNDHPSDKASYAVRVTVPAGLTAVSNGELKSRHTKHGMTTWSWEAREPMASYLATATVGEFDLDAYRNGRIKMWDAIDPDLFDAIAAPRTGTQFALSQVGDLSYKRLARTISVPAAGGAQLSFWMTRDTETDWDFAFVEAHEVGTDAWTTLPDLNGHTSAGTGDACPSWLDLHPFIEHYQTDDGDGTCSPTGTTGRWFAASGSSDGAEQWAVDLTPFAGKSVEVSISYASDGSVQGTGLFVDDIVSSTGEGTTSFEDDGNTFDGWTVPGAPAGSEPNPNDWIVGTAADAPATAGEIAQGSFARQGEIIDFLEDQFGRYPFSAGGGIVDDLDGVGFALENQTRPIYAKDFFGDSISGDSVVVHEIAHQWFGDDLAVAKWRNIWLNEGFATYAEWLWSEHDDLGTAQENFDFFYNEIWPEDDPFWDVIVGDPGPDGIFDNAIYYRGAMTLHQLRLAVGDKAFFRTLREWAASNSRGNVTIEQFIRLAERVSHQDLDDLFETWLFTPGRPELPSSTAASAGTARAQSLAGSRTAPPVARAQLGRSKLAGR